MIKIYTVQLVCMTVYSCAVVVGFGLHTLLFPCTPQPFTIVNGLLPTTNNPIVATSFNSLQTWGEWRKHYSCTVTMETAVGEELVHAPWVTTFRDMLCFIIQS